MAVKQVELGQGKARTSERTLQMVKALEREVELLKELQHDNIVQYLGKFSYALRGPPLTHRLID
jgi:mitogen-activated protein kinase kinase kinase